MADGDAASLLPGNVQGFYLLCPFNELMSSIPLTSKLYTLISFLMLICYLLGRFLRMFLGPINVRASRKDVQLKVKEEYNSYKV